MRLPKTIKKLVKIALLSTTGLGGLSLLDIVVHQNLYHPLTYLYQGGSLLACQVTSLSSCQTETTLTPILGKNVVVTSQHEATQVGIDILTQGGNAIDAAVAIGYALAVVEPCCGNLGGGGFMLIRTADGRETFLNFREKAPIDAHATLYHHAPASASTQGYLAVAIPGSVKGLEYARQKYGTLSRSTLIQPSIERAEQGFRLQSGDVKMMERHRQKFESANIQAIFLKNGQLYQVGEIFKQPQLAQTLRLIATQGESAFYQGEIAQKMVKASQQQGGILRLEDFQGYQIEETPPLHCTYQNHLILTAPAPGGGIPLCQMLNILQAHQLEKITSETHYWHTVFSAMLFAYADRNAYLGDPNFVSLPIENLLSQQYAQQLSQRIPEKQAIDPKTVYQSLSDSEGHQTTHYSVIDAQGNAVAVTTTINSNFGAGVMAEDTGFFLNNEMDDFTTRFNTPNQFGLVQGKANLIEPQKRPLSSMTPTIVVKNERPILITGSPGGPTIITTVLQVLLNYFLPRSEEIVNTPKLHYQGIPPVVFSEPNALSPQAFAQLSQMGYKIIPMPTWGAAETILYDPTQHLYQGLHDSRKPQGQASAF